MSDSGFRVRRATIDDLEGLRNLSRAMGYSTEGLEKRITEFQVAVSGGGEIFGALGLEVSGRCGRLHGEAFLDFTHADELRAEFWRRLQLVAANYGVARFWTEESAPFWRRQGFGEPNEVASKKLPAVWTRDGAKWLTLQVWDEDAVEKSIAREMASFKANEQAEVNKALRRGHMLKFIATMLAIILAIFVGIFALRVLQSHFDSGSR